MRVICLLLLCTVLSGCAARTEYGECIGINAARDPMLKYELSVRNLMIAGFFMSTVWVPIVVAATAVYCPTGIKEK